MRAGGLEQLDHLAAVDHGGEKGGRQARAPTGKTGARSGGEGSPDADHVTMSKALIGQQFCNSLRAVVVEHCRAVRAESGLRGLALPPFLRAVHKDALEAMRRNAGAPASEP